jgi:hypothetical protein
MLLPYPAREKISTATVRPGLFTKKLNREERQERQESAPDWSPDSILKHQN